MRSLKSTGVMDHLEIPAECVLRTQDPNEPPRLQCHTSLKCQRCGFCIAHCECGPKREAKPKAKRLRRGEVDEAQMQLCEKPELRTAR